MAERSKAPDSSSGGAIRVGSNPTADMYFFFLVLPSFIALFDFWMALAWSQATSLTIPIGQILALLEQPVGIASRLIRPRGDLAQMVERSLSMREALGSMPRFSSFLYIQSHVARQRERSSLF